MIYVTLLDQFHPGIYSSQVIDVCDYLNHRYKANIRVVAFLSIRELKNTDAKKKLKQLSPTAIVLPAFPGLKNFQLTSFLLFFVCLFTGERVAICRNVFCTKMALRLKKWGLLKKVVMDGRSAMAAEIGEYDVFPVDYLRNNVAAFEKYAVNTADFRMAVSNKLIGYWNEKYGYNKQEHVVIPCTLDRKYFDKGDFVISPETKTIKAKLNISDEDIVLAYAGSTAPWQSFKLLEQLFVPLLQKDARIKILFLSKESEDNRRLQAQFPDRIMIHWLEHKDVLNYLACCDYGILVREQSDTNKVASPTKFAEYLAAGLQVLISENLGDFSSFVKEHNCGIVISEGSDSLPAFRKSIREDKKACFGLSKKYFDKGSEINDAAYQKLFSFLSA
jgi:hypothetical protein